MKRINEFISKSKNNNKPALIFKKGSKWIRKSFSQFLNDVFKMNSLIHEQIKDDNVLIFSHPYTYDFYVTAFGTIFSGKNLVIIDSFRDREKLKSMIESANISTMICDNLTRFLAFIFPKKIRKINAKEFNNYTPKESINDSGNVITFTSGTTGTPKKITRTISFLFNQMDLVEENTNFTQSELVYGQLPMYTLMSLFLGNTTIISKNPNQIAKQNPTALITSINSIKKIKKPLMDVQKAFIGGAILYENEAKNLQSKLPNADITYVYGASESAMIYKTSISKYLKKPFSFDEPIKGIDVSILNKDENGVGEISITGKMVISENNIHNSGDLGVLENNILRIVGRKKYSLNNFYNYKIDQEILLSNPKIKEAFSFAYDDKKYVFYVGTIQNKIEGIMYKKVSKIPHDLKHKTKADYSKLINFIKRM